MAEGEDKESRTEEPTERKISDAIEKGNVPFAREAVTLGSLLAILLVCKLMLSWSAGETAEALGIILENAGLFRLGDREDATILLAGVMVRTASAILPIMLVIAAGSIVAALAQNMPQAAADRIMPKWSRISPAAGWSRLFGLQSIVEFAKTMVKLGAVTVVTALVLKSEADGMFATLRADPGGLPHIMLAMVVKIVSALCIVAVLLAIGDVTWSRLKWRRGLRMTRHELKEEFRQSEGDPQIRARFRSVARQRTSRKMFARLPTATMVITNPTHFAVALRYIREEGGAPVVVAKGADFLALRIREAATANEIPMVENKPLARALYDTVGVDDVIPPELYKAVAEIIHFLQLRKMYTAPAARR